MRPSIFFLCPRKKSLKYEKRKVKLLHDSVWSQFESTANCSSLTILYGGQNGIGVAKKAGVNPIKEVMS